MTFLFPYKFLMDVIPKYFPCFVILSQYNKWLYYHLSTGYDATIVKRANKIINIVISFKSLHINGKATKKTYIN